MNEDFEDYEYDSDYYEYDSDYGDDRDAGDYSGSMRKLGKYLKGLRKGFPLAAVRRATGVSESAIRMLEKGEYHNMPQPSVMRDIVRYYSISMYTIFEKAGYIIREEDGSWLDRHYNRIKRKFIGALAAYASDRKEIRKDREKLARITTLLHKRIESNKETIQDKIILDKISKIIKGSASKTLGDEPEFMWYGTKWKSKYVK